MPGGSDRYSTGSRPLRSFTPWWLDGRKPLPQRRSSSPWLASLPVPCEIMHDERRQVLGLAAQAVAEPRPEARPAGLLDAGLDERDGRVVVDRLGVHRPDEAHVVGDLAGVRQQFAEPRARPCRAGANLNFGGDDREALLPAGHAGEPLAHADRVGQFAGRATSPSFGL